MDYNTASGYNQATSSAIDENILDALESLHARLGKVDAELASIVSRVAQPRPMSAQGSSIGLAPTPPEPRNVPMRLSRVRDSLLRIEASTTEIGRALG